MPCMNHTPYVFLLLSRMHEPRPIQSCLVTNENESYEVEKLSSTSPLSSATAVNQNNKQQRKLYSSYLLLLLTTKRTRVMYATSLLIRFWLQYCYSYTEKLYTSKSYHIAYSGYSKLVIVYHDGTCELIGTIIMQFSISYT